MEYFLVAIIYIISTATNALVCALVILPYSLLQVPVDLNSPYKEDSQNRYIYKTCIFAHFLSHGSLCARKQIAGIGQESRTGNTQNFLT